MSKKLLYPVMAFAAVMTILFTGGTTLAAMTLKYGVATAPNHYYTVGAEAFAEEVKKATNGEVIINVFAGGQLATGERELVEGIQFGTVDLCLVSTGAVVGFDPDFQLFSLPYLFADEDAAYRAVDETPMGEGFNKHMERQGVSIVGWAMGGAWINTNSKRPVNKPEDLKGLKIRCMESPIIIETLKSFGALGTPMSLGEAFTAMQQGTVDGQENALPSTYANKYYEVQKYMAMTNHMILPSPIMMSTAKLKAMKPELREQFMKGAAEGVKRQREVYAQQAAESIDGMKQRGIEVTYPDLEPFKQASSYVYDMYIPKLSAEAQEWVNMIRTAR